MRRKTTWFCRDCPTFCETADLIDDGHGHLTCPHCGSREVELFFPGDDVIDEVEPPKKTDKSSDTRKTDD